MPTVARTDRRLFSSDVSMPSTYTLPPVGSRMALKCLASVLLPEPLCPSTATNEPRAISSERSPSVGRSSPG